MKIIDNLSCIAMEITCVIIAYQYASNASSQIRFSESSNSSMVVGALFFILMFVVEIYRRIMNAQTEENK
jgi:hypothetical protein